MYIPEYRSSKEGVPILSQYEIDDIAERFVKDFQPDALLTRIPVTHNYVFCLIVRPPVMRVMA